MSRKESTVEGDPTESTGSPVRGQDNQESEGMSASLNSGAGTSVGVQSTSDCQTPVSGQERERVKRGVSSRTRKQTTTYSLTTHQQELAQKPRKAKSRKSKGVKASGLGGAKPGSVPGAGRGRGSVRPFSRLHSNWKVFDFWITPLSLRTQTKRVREAHYRLHTLNKGASLTSLLSLQ